MATTLGGTDLPLDEVHSFVLRISIDRARGGQGKPRPQFQLEHVNSQKTCRTRTLEEACAVLALQVKSIFEELESGDIASIRGRDSG